MSIASIAVVVCAFPADETLAFSTFAGSTNAGSADGIGTGAGFKQPHGIARDRDGNLYVADTSNHTIRKVTPGGEVTTLAGQAGFFGGFQNGTGANALFSGPCGLVVDGAGVLYVADTVNQAIRQVTPAGVVTTIAGELGPPGSTDGPGNLARFHYPYAIAIDSVGSLFVADTLNHTIRKIVRDGSGWQVTTVAGAAGATGSADGAGVDARFQSPIGLAIDGADNVYIADSSNNTLRKMTPAGVVSTLAGVANPLGGSADGTGGAAAFRTPTGLAVDGAGNIYVADERNHTIRKVTPGGVVTTVGGDASITNANGRPVGGYSDGTGTGARFKQPTGVVVDSAGNLFVADRFNHLLRKGVAGTAPPEIVFTNPGFATGSGRFGVDLTGPTGQAVIIEGSGDLLNWLPITTNTLNEPINFIEPPGPGFPVRFFRARTP